MYSYFEKLICTHLNSTSVRRRFQLQTVLTPRSNKQCWEYEWSKCVWAYFKTTLNTNQFIVNLIVKFFISGSIKHTISSINFCVMSSQRPTCPDLVPWSTSLFTLISWVRCVLVAAPSPSALPNLWRSWRPWRRSKMRKTEERSCCWSSPELSCCRLLETHLKHHLYLHCHD